MAASIPIISPITRRHFPSSIIGNRRLQRRPLKLLQRRSLKMTPPPVKHPTPPTPSLLAFTAPSLSSFRAELSFAGELPFHRLPSHGTPPLSSPARPSVLALRHRNGRRLSSGKLPRAAMAASPRWTGVPVVHGPWARLTGFSVPK
jgi:hypothetical protein